MRFTILLLFATPALSDPPEILNAQLERSGNASRVSVTLSHPDTGWDHHADGWRVETVDGTVLGTRRLVHPHVEEQPFTRSLADLDIPEGTTQLVIRSRCSVDGWSRTSVLIVIP